MEAINVILQSVLLISVTLQQGILYAKSLYPHRYESN